MKLGSDGACLGSADFFFRGKKRKICEELAISFGHCSELPLEFFGQVLLHWYQLLLESLRQVFQCPL